MPTLANWHDSKCPGPKIKLEDHKPNCEIKDTCHLLPQCRFVPYCVACGQKPPLHDIISEHSSSSTFTAMPQDKPFGHMNLYWPSRSLYRGSTDSVTSDKAKHEQALCNIYPTTLLPGQFRQALLSPTGRAFKHTRSTSMEPYYPVHVTLETYEDDNCPEYEAFSYTWAGEHPEDEGQHLCCPVYIGQSWNVLMQTRNCWELLRFARLPRATRHVWVDALCINQDNIEEKTQQVAKMGQIYRESSRVVVYLGPDLAVKPERRFPRRHHFDQLASGEIRPKSASGSLMDFDLERLFRRRYFARLWVIQELILSSKAIIRIGDIDVSIDSIITKRLENKQGWDWAKTPAAWFQYVSRQTLGSDPCEALQLVSNTSCSDSRDRLFGILGLMDPEYIVNQGVQADYSLSSQHIWIGFFAHCLLRLDIVWFLAHAAGPPTSSEGQKVESWVPSWVPDWTSLLTWQRFQRPMLSYEEMADEIRRVLATEEPSYKHSTASVRMAPDIRRLITGVDIESRTHWNQGAVVDAKTGALSHIQVIHLFAIPSSPQLRTHLRDYGVYEIDLFGMHWLKEDESPTKEQLGDRLWSSPTQRLYLVSQQALDKKISPLNDHLYVQYTNHGLQFLILRDFGDSLSFLEPRLGPACFSIGDRQNVYLVAAIPYLFLSFGFSRVHDSQPTSWKPLSIEDLPRLSTVGGLIDSICFVLNASLQSHHGWRYNRFRSEQDYLYRSFFGEALLKRSCINEFFWGHIFADAKNSDFLPLYWELSNEILLPDSCSNEKLENSYIASVKQKFGPVIRKNYLQLQFQADESEHFNRYYNKIYGPKELRMDAYDIEWSYKGSIWSKFPPSSSISKGRLGPREFIYIRFKRSLVLSTIRKGGHIIGMAKSIIWLRDVLGINDLGELQKRLADTQEKLHHLKLEQAEFAVDGGISTINIL